MKRKALFTTTQRHTAFGIAHDAAAIMQSINWRTLENERGEVDSRYIQGECAAVAMAIAERIHATGHDPFAEGQLDFIIDIADPVAAILQAGDEGDWNEWITLLLLATTPNA